MIAGIHQRGSGSGDFDIAASGARVDRMTVLTPPDPAGRGEAPCRTAHILAVAHDGSQREPADTTHGEENPALQNAVGVTDTTAPAC